MKTSIYTFEDQRKLSSLKAQDPKHIVGLFPAIWSDKNATPIILMEVVPSELSTVNINLLWSQKTSLHSLCLRS